MDAETQEPTYKTDGGTLYTCAMLLWPGLSGHISHNEYDSGTVNLLFTVRGELCYRHWCTVYPKKYAHGFCSAVFCCCYTLTDFPISTRLTSLALWQSNDCPSASKATLMNMDKYFMWIHYERLRNHNKAKHNKTVSIFLGIYCIGENIVLNPFALLFGAWWRHQMETFFALLAICAGNSPVPGEFPAQRPVTRTFDVFFDPRLY